VNAWKVILATLVIFGAGMVAGNLLGRRANPVESAPARESSVPSANPSQLRLWELLHRMDRELGLTSEQHENIEKIIAGSQERTRKLWSPIAQEMRKETQSVCEEIRGQLTPDQRKKFDNFARSHSEHHKTHSETNEPEHAVELTNSAPVDAHPAGFK
jgi:NACalpha-BTF3-like transcription factor